MLLLPAVRSVEIDEGDGNLLFCSAPFRTDVVHDGANDAVAHDDLIAAVLKDETGATWSRIRAGLDY
jgi:hypothetical protein